MTPEQEAAIRKAARDYQEACDMVQWHMLINTPDKPEDRLLLAEERELAYARKLEAERTLRLTQEVAP